MAEGLVYKIGADVTDLEKGVSKAESTLKNAGTTTKAFASYFNELTIATEKPLGPLKSLGVNLNSLSGIKFPKVAQNIAEIEDELKRFNTVLKTATGQALIDTNKNIANLNKQLKDLKSTGLDNVKKSASDGANALNSIGQVTRDLPFGFIAIQNNLPQVVDSFGALAKQSGGALPALKALGASLAGPAGIAFAFGAVTAGVTALIQKYGSLGNAIDVIFAKNKELAALQQEFNKTIFQTTGELAAENAKVDILTKTIANNKTSQDKRIAAYYELKKIAPDVVAGIKDENFGTEASNLLVAANAQLRKESIRLKIQESGINAVLAKNAADKAEQEFELNKIAQKRLELNKQIKDKPFTPTGQNLIDIRLSQLSELEAQILTQSKVVDNLYGIENKYLKQLEPITLGIANINTQTTQRIKNLKQEIAEGKNYYFNLKEINDFISNEENLTSKKRLENLQNYANILLNVNKTEKERKNALNNLNKENNNFFKNLNIGVTSISTFETALNSLGSILQENIINEDLYNKSVKNLIPTFDILKIRQEERNKLLTEEKKLVSGFNYKLPEINPPNVEFQKLLSFKIQLNTEDFKKKLDILKTNFEATKNVLSDVFFNPLQDLFSNFINTGKLAFADFGKAVLKAINQIIAKIIATGIITLLANLLFPGLTKESGGLGKSLLTGIGSALGFNLGGNVAAPSFAGVGGGSLGMSGQVNVVLRGSDLVGSINRTNATINRVG